MSSDPNDRADLPEPDDQSPPSTDQSTDQPPTPDESESKPRRKILIGSQRDPAAYSPKPRRDWKPTEQPAAPPVEEVSQPTAEPPTATEVPQPPREVPPPAPPIETPVVETPVVETPVAETPVVETAAATSEPAVETPSIDVEPVEEEALSAAAESTSGHFPLPNLRAGLSDDLEAEFQEALGDASLEDLIADTDAVTKQTLLDEESMHVGTIVLKRREDVFVELGGREQGVVPLRHFEEEPELGTQLEVRIVRFVQEDGLYDLALPGMAAEIGDWSDLAEGMTVDAQVTGHNTGGLECEVNHIPGFIPISQVSLYRVENLEEFVGQKFTCLVTEANPDRRNLVLSHRAILEREREQARLELLKSLAVGQIHEGVVRKIMDFGAFVDLGGVEGLLHISELGWGRVKHPSDVIAEGQTIKVSILKLDVENDRISFGFRDQLQNPWDHAEASYPPNSQASGRVTKLMEFGAFVELEPGVEGLVHISELAHRRVFRASDVVNEGDEVEVMVLSVDVDAQRMSLSMKDLIENPADAKKEESDEEVEAAPLPEKAKKPAGPLKGGLRSSTGGEQFGLKW